MVVWDGFRILVFDNRDKVLLLFSSWPRKADPIEYKRIKNTIDGRVWLGGLKTGQSDGDSDCLGKVVEKETLLTC